jgi:hypothetical protein
MRELKWADIAHVAYALGLLPDRGKGANFILRKTLLDSGKVQHVGRGRYRIAHPPRSPSAIARFVADAGDFTVTPPPRT